MRRIIAVTGVLGCVVACSAAPTNEPEAVVATEVPTTAPAGTTVLATIEGSFDGATRKFTIAYRNPTTGELMPEVGPVPLPYGQTLGNVYLHTEGTPLALNGQNELPATVDAENGLGGTVSLFSVALTFTPANVGMIVGGATSCSGATLGDANGGKAGPCAVSYGAVNANATFPTPDGFNKVSWLIDDQLNAGAGFHFTGNITGLLPTETITIVDATLGPDCRNVHYAGNTVTVGNDTANLTTHCNGHAAPCTLPSIGAGLADPAVGCRKDWAAHYKCNGGPTKEVFKCGVSDNTNPDIPSGFPPPLTTCEASGSSVQLTCP